MPKLRYNALLHLQGQSVALDAPTMGAQMHSTLIIKCNSLSCLLLGSLHQAP